MKFLMLASLAESAINFRGPLITALQKEGFQVHIAAPGLAHDSIIKNQLEELGIITHNIPMLRTGMNPISDIRTFLAIIKISKKIRPRFSMGYTIKPVIYGSLAAWLTGIPQRYALITGLGYTFQGYGERKHLNFLIRIMYRISLLKIHKIFFQNPDDEAIFREKKIINSLTSSCIINGSGVDVAAFCVSPLPAEPHFLLIARLLGDKGVREYAKAAQRIKARHPQARFALVGWIDENPDAIAQAELDQWVQGGTLEYLGRLQDVRPAIAACTVYVLPSYREGTPRTVLEAMAMGRPIITTDAPGCRETVVNGDNGFLVPVKSVEALEQAMLRFIEDPALAPRMGHRSRQMAEDKYDVHKVNAVMLREMGIS